MIGDPRQRQRILDRLPFLERAAPVFRDELLDTATFARLPAGRIICQDGAQCALLPLVIAGTGRVYKLGENGREITLYRIEPGESCVLTAACILSGRVFPAFAECERAVEAVVIPPAAARRWMASSDAWRAYLFDQIASRLEDVFGVLDAVLFQRLDQRLIDLLLRRRAATGAGDIRMTHQNLAVELGSSREVISRILKGLEGQGLLRIERGHIALLDPAGLERRAREGG